MVSSGQLGRVINPELKKKKMSVQEIEKQKLNYISTLREKKLTMLHLFAFV